MENKIDLIIIFPLFLYLLNQTLIKFNFNLDFSLRNEKHKQFLNKNINVPLSGSIYFATILICFFYKIEQFPIIFCLLFFILGFFSDIKLLNSPRLRLVFQFFLLTIFLYYNDIIVIDTRINFLNSLMSINFMRIIIISFFFLVLINGFNFIDGTNNLCSINFFLVLAFTSYLFLNNGYDEYNDKITTLIISICIFIFFNFFGKNFLGDGGVYGLSFFIGFLLIKLSNLDPSVSPYFIANLLWYPAFENLFSIIRRLINKKKNYLPDNYHLHQLIYKFLLRKLFSKKNYVISSLTGIIINLYLFIIFFILYLYYSKTDVQIMLIFINTFLYTYLYFKLKMK